MDLIPDLLPNGMDVADEPPPGEDEHNIISLIPLDNSSEETRNNTTELASYPESILHFDPDEGDYWDRRPAAALFEPDVPNLLAECDRLCQPVFFPRSTDQFGSATPWGVVELAKITARAAPQRSREGEDASSSGTSSAQSPYHSHMVSAPSSQTDRALSSGLNASFEVQPTDLLARLKAPNASHGSRPSTSRSPAVIRAPSDSFVAHPSVLASQLSSISAVSGGPSRIVVESQKSGPAQPLVTPATGDVQISSMAIEQEGRILSRIADLRKEGKWEDSRIPKCVIAEPFSRGVKNFTKEVTWVATLIAKERKAKIALAKKIAYAAKRWHEKRAEQVRRMEREEEQRLRKVAKSIGGLVLGWWGEVRKVAQMKQKEEIEVRKQDIRKLHLRHLMDQTEEFSSRMAQGLARSSSTASITATPKPVEVVEDPNDKEYNEAEDSSFEDEEDTISDEEGKESTGDNQMDARQLEDDANIPLEDLLPPGYREMFLAPSTDQPSIKRKRTSSKTLTSDVYELEPKPKKLKEEDDLSLLVNLPTEEEIEDNVMFDEKVKSHEAALEKLQPKGTSLSSTEVVTAVPFLLRGDLREYQHVGLDWLVSLYNNKMNGILADEMGLGKTIQTIAFIAHLASEKNNWGPHLVIVPTSVLLNWELEFKRWCPGLIIKTYYGSRKQRSDLRTGWTKPDSFHICITSYKVATQDYSSFRRMRWRYLILDEAQAIKNYKSQRWMRIAEFPSERRLLLTGTPMQNSLEEVWALLHFLAPELFESLNMFQQLFSNLTAMSEGRKPQDQAIVKQLHTVLRPFILRRMKAEVETQLPKKYEQVLKCRLSKRQRYLYDDYMSRSKTRETLKAGNYLSVINILMQLRKVCNHPNLFEERPVLSPFVMPHQLRLEYPALVFEVLYRDTTDAPYFREVSTSLTKPFSTAPKNLTSFDSSRLAELLPTDDRMLLASDASKPLALPRPLPLGFSTCFDTLGLTITDLMAGTPFFPIEDNRLCTESCIHPSPVVTKLRAFTTVASVHTGRVKKAAKKKPDRRNGLSVGALTNGTKKSKPIHALSIESSRVSTKYFTEDLRPSRFRLQREDHSEVLLTANRRKCTTLPLLAGNLVTLLSLDRDDAEPRRSSFKTGFLQCHRAQKENLNPLPFKTRTFGLAGLTEMGASAEKRLDQAEERYWIDHGSVAYDPVRMPPPVLAVHNMPSSFDQKTAAWQDLLRPALEEVSERLHPVERLRVMKFPETRLIQYDCGKLQMLDELLRERFAGGHRCLIFTQMTKVLDVLEVFLTYHGYNYLRLDGSTGIELRQTLMDRFNRDPRYFVFILSTRSGGVGVNLTGADTVVFYDSDWNPTMDAQAQDRCHRIGQTRDVNIYRLISEYTVEENILEKATQKRILGHLAIESGGFTTGVLKRENFKDIFGLKDDEVANAMPDDAVDEESAIAKVEDPEDVAAAKKAKTEAAQDEEDDDDDDEPRFKSIQKFLNPIQCFGVKYVEEYALNQEVMEELEQTREEVERRKREWELSRLELAQTERANAAVEASEPFNVSRSLMDPKFYQDPLTLAYPQECQDADMPDFYYRDASPSSDKENSHDLFIADFTKWSGPLFREPPPELAMPSSKNKSKGKKRKDKMPPDPMLGSKSSRRKKDQVSPMGLDSSGLGRLMRTPSHMGMLRDYSNMGGLDIPDSLATLENATADWKPFEDWQIVMTSAMLQGHPQNSQQTLPSMNNISCDLVSYVTSTANVRYRQGRDCQVRLKTLRMREDKDQIMEALPTPKKKKKKTEENLSVDKSLFPVPKRAVNSLQEDNGRARTQVYRDVFSSWRSQHYNPPNIQRRDVVSAQQRVGAGAWSNAVFQECHIVLDEPVNPLTMLKQRQEKANLPKTFITERTLRWAQTLNTTVDTQGQKVDFQAGASPLQPKSSVASILQQTLQQSGAGGSMMPRTSSGSGGGSMAQLATGPGGGMQQQPLPSPQFIAANPNQVRRQAQLPSTNSMTLTAPSSNPLPSLGSSVMNQYMTSNVTQQQPMANMTSGGPVHSGDSGAAMQHPLPQPPVQGPVTIKLTAQQQRAQQMQVLRQIFALPPNQTTYYQHDITRIKEFLANRGITFSDNQLADLARAFSTKNPPNATPGTVADGAGGGTATFQQLSPQPSQLVLSPQQQQQQQSPQQQPVPVTPLQIAPAPQVTVSGARPMVVNSRLPNVQSTGGQTTVRLNFVNQLGPQAPQAVRQQQTKPRPSMIAVKNGQAAAAPQVYAQPALAPAAAASSSQPQQPVAIQPNPVVRAGATVMSVSVPQLQQLRRMVVPGAQNMIDLSLVSGDMAAPRSLVANSAVINNINFSPVAIQQQLAMLQQNPQVGGGALKREPDSASPPAPGSGTVPEPS